MNSHDAKPYTTSSSHARMFSSPHTLQIEIEFTNICNAKCVACPRSNMPEQGILQNDTLTAILDRYQEDGITHNELPRVVVAGGGEPLIHKNAVKLLEKIIKRGFETTLISNASAITESTARELAGLGLHTICISFWGIKKSEYESSMKLPFEKILRKVELLAEELRTVDTELLIVWVRTPEIQSSDQEVAEFWAERNIDVDLSDTVMWNRGGLLSGNLNRSISGDYPDPERKIWCADLYFSDSYNWKGQNLMCCCNFFTTNQVIILDNANASMGELAEGKSQLIKNRPLPAMCKHCQLPRKNRSSFLLRENFDNLSVVEKKELTEFPLQEWVCS